MPAETIVSGTPPAAAVPAAAAAAAAAVAAAPAVEAAALQAQIDELKEQVAEGQRTAQYWADRAKAGTPVAAAAEEEPDVLEAITTGGAKGFDALAKKRGFIQRDEVENLISQRAASLTQEQQLLQDYPDLKKKDSEFFKATAVAYGDLVKSGVPQAVAMGNAARQTELAFIKGGKIKLPAGEPSAADKETARLARIAAQSGDGGRRGAAPAGDESDEPLTPQQKHMIAAMGISEEAYIKRAKAGVAMKGLG
jgi:hypothetical protein